MADFLIGGQIDPASHQRTANATIIASTDLTTHGVIVGMTGSGKTGLGVVLIEDALRAGVPTIVIDPKGDLTNLCLTFPNLAPADFEPWVNPGDAEKDGLTVAEFASQQAAAWTQGLAGWNLGPADIAALRSSVEFTVYTPGSTGGVGLNIIGSLQAPLGNADPEIVGDEVEGLVSGLLGLVGVVADPLSSREHILLCNIVLHEWSAGRDLDLASLISAVQTPPFRKLGVFELDTFFPPKDRTELALRLNGLLASPSFEAWLRGPVLDIDTLLKAADGRPRCAIVCTAHLSDEERQFVTTLVLSKLVTWMRRQSGTTDLRVLLYMDEVAGYLPPTAMPPTKKPIMTLIKQARAFGVGVVLSTQNPVDVDYKALSNAGTWMIGRLQTDRDKARLVDGMSVASGGVDTSAISTVIGGLAKREFVLRRAGRDQPEVFTTRWAMSYLRGPLTRDQIAELMADQNAALAGSPSSQPSEAVPMPTSVDDGSTLDATSLMPTVASGVAVRWAEPAAPWVAAIRANQPSNGGSGRAAPVVVARVALRYDDTKADLLYDDVYEAVLFPLGKTIDVSLAIGVDYDDRDLRTDAPPGISYELTDAPIGTKQFWSGVERDLVAHLVRSRSMQISVNRSLKLYGRPGETAEAFAARCVAMADERADAETAKLRDKFEARATRLRDQLQTAQDRTELLETQRDGRRDEELLSTAGSILGGLLGGRKSRGGLLGSVLGQAGPAAGRRSRTSAADDRLEAAENKTSTLREQVEDLESDLVAEVTAIDERWSAAAAELDVVSIPLERTDVSVVSLVLAWIPVLP